MPRFVNTSSNLVHHYKFFESVSEKGDPGNWSEPRFEQGRRKTTGRVRTNLQKRSYHSIDNKPFKKGEYSPHIVPNFLPQVQQPAPPAKFWWIRPLRLGFLSRDIRFLSTALGHQELNPY